MSPPAGALPSAVTPPATRGEGAGAGFRRWWREPTLNPWVLGALALLLFLRKPHALHTPQLYAEDGSIFLAFNDAFGARVILEPYMGYLHLIPRLTAWAAPFLLDVAWWPAFYNGIAFVLWVAVIARTFSPRLPLPGKPWLALAFIVGPQTGEILFNITNVQWITAFVFVQQALLTPPVTRAQRVGDLLALAVVALTGPFSIVFAPLLAWRWWRERNADTLAPFLVVVAGAAVQALFIASTHEDLQFRPGPFQPWAASEVIARRLLIWPVAGNQIAHTLPSTVSGLLGVLVIGGAVALMLRSPEQRALRGRLVIAFALILAVGVFRCRPDTWGGDDLNFSDRYFYLPRVLFAWMLILQFGARPRPVAWVARGLAAAMAVVHLGDYVLPAPPDYHWKENCDPIRRGEPADIKTLPEGWWIEYRGRAKR